MKASIAASQSFNSSSVNTITLMLATSLSSLILLATAQLASADMQGAASLVPTQTSSPEPAVEGVIIDLGSLPTDGLSVKELALQKRLFVNATFPFGSAGRSDSGSDVEKRCFLFNWLFHIPPRYNRPVNPPYSPPVNPPRPNPTTASPTPTPTPNTPTTSAPPSSSSPSTSSRKRTRVTEGFGSG